MSNLDILLTLKYGNELFADPRRIALLKAINHTGSLSQAARQIGISYKTAWDCVNDINKLSETPFFITSIGGKGGGGTRLSEYALRFIELYDLLTQMQMKAFNTLKSATIPLNDVLKVAASVSLQSSARNQLYGTIESIHVNEVAGFVSVLLHDKQTIVRVYVTHSSIERLNLVIGKDVILLIKAPQIELIQRDGYNHYCVNIEHVTLSTHWSEFTLRLPSSTLLYASRPITEFNQLKLKQNGPLDIFINPENIIIASLI